MGSDSNNIDDHIIQAANETNLDPKLIASVIKQESNNNPSAVSPKGAIGLMQLMPDTAKELGVDPDDPLDNVLGGSRYLQKMIDSFGSVEGGLAAYNWGPENYSRFLKNGGKMPGETVDYVMKVMNYYQGNNRQPTLRRKIF